VSVTLGLEDLAETYLLTNGYVSKSENLQQLSRPGTAEEPVPPTGEAAIAQFLVRTSIDGARELLRAPVVQSVMAFLGETTLEDEHIGGWSNCGWSNSTSLHDEGIVPTGALNEVYKTVRHSTYWSDAVELLGFAPKTFRASCVFSVKNPSSTKLSNPKNQTATNTTKSFDGRDVAMAMGGAVMQSQGWKVDLYHYDTELYGFLWQNRFTCGILLGGEWRPPSQNPLDYKFSVAPFGETLARPYPVHSRDLGLPWYMPKLRPSTALLLLLLCGVKDGDVVWDPMGGSGTIAIEAAAFFEVDAVSSDNDRNTTAAAVRNVRDCRPYLREQSTCAVRDLDATMLHTRGGIEEGSVDRIVADTPFGQRCRWNVSKELPLLLDSIATVLNPNTGRCVLLMKGYKRLEGLLDPNDEDAPRPLSKLRLVERRDVNVGGFLCYALVLAHKQTPQ